MNRLPLNVSSKLTNLEASATALQLTAYANATPTAEKAPVLVAVQSAKHIDADAFANQLCAEGGQGTPAQARLLVNALASVFGTLVETYGAITVNTPFGTVQTFITGTLENPQDQPDPATNYPFLAVVVPEVYRKLFASFETYVPAEACPVTLRRVRDKATDRPGICGTQPFYLEGSGMTFGGDGEKLELLDPVTKVPVASATVDLGSATKIQFACTLAGTAAVAKGKYVLRLTTLAGGESTLWPADLEVELLEAIPEPAKPRVTATELKVIKTSVDTEYDIFGLENVEAIRGYSEGEPPRFDARISINGEEPFDDSFNFLGGTEKKASITNLHGDVGDRVTLTLEVDPSKTEYDQTPCVLEATVVAE